MQRFGVTLRQYRKQQHLTQQALATSTGIRRAYISQIELGLHNISVLMLLRLAHALGIPAAYLLARLDTHVTFIPPVMGDPLTPRSARDAVVIHDDTCSPQPSDPAILLPLLGATIRQYRQQQGLFQVALATLTGLSPTYIIEIEQGQRNLSVLSLVRIADALGLSVAHLLAPIETRQGCSSPLK